MAEKLRKNAEDLYAQKKAKAEEQINVVRNEFSRKKTNIEDQVNMTREEQAEKLKQIGKECESMRAELISIYKRKKQEPA